MRSRLSSFRRLTNKQVKGVGLLVPGAFLLSEEFMDQK